MLEESSAVQCPSVAYQLAGAKKVQQDLANPETLERFLDSPEEVELARSCFAGMPPPLPSINPSAVPFTMLLSEWGP